MKKNKHDLLIKHLESLRSVLIKCILALSIGILPLFFVTPYVLETLINVMMRYGAVKLHFFSPLEVFILQIKIAIVLDILVCFPYMAKQIWSFILPGLYDKERKFIKSIVVTSGILFIAGVLFCLFFILPLIIRFGIGFATDNIQAVFGIANIVSLALWLSLVFGIMFQFPLITFALLRAKIVSYEAIKNKRAYVFVSILIISGLLTPPDIISQIVLTIPTYALFETALFLGKNTQS